jgi:hypothetical protein
MKFKIGKVLELSHRIEYGVVLNIGRFFFYCAWFAKNYEKMELDDLQQHKPDPQPNND